MAAGNRYVISFETRGAKKAQTQAKGVGGALGGLAGKAMLAGAAFFAARGLINAFKSSVETGKKFEQSMANLKALTGATGTSFLKLENDALRLGAATKFTASQVGELQTEYGKLGFTTQQILGATEATLALAAATGEDLGVSATVAGATLKGFGIQAKNTNRVTDVMAKSFASSALDMSKFSESMKYVAPVAAAAGFKIEDTTAVLGALANVGIHGSMAGTALKNVFIAMSDESSALSERLGGSISSTEEMEESFGRLKEEGFTLAEAVELVGKRSAPAFLAMVNGSKDIGELTTMLENAQGAADTMARIQMATLEGRMLTLQSASEGLQIAFFDTFEEGLSGAVKGVTTLIQSMTSFLAVPMSAKIEENRIEFNALFDILEDINEEEGIRQLAIEKLQTVYPEYIKNLDLEKLTAEGLAKARKEANDEFMREIEMQSAREALKKYSDEVVRIRLNLFEMKQALSEAQESQKGMSKITKTFVGDAAMPYAVAVQVGTEALAIAKEELVLYTNALLGGSEVQKQVIKEHLNTGKATKEETEEIKKLAEEHQKLVDGLEDGVLWTAQYRGVVDTLDKSMEKWADSIEKVKEKQGDLKGLADMSMWEAIGEEPPTDLFDTLDIMFRRGGIQAESFWEGIGTSMEEGLQTSQDFVNAASDIYSAYFDMEKQKLDNAMAAEIKAVQDGPLNEKKKQEKIADIKAKFQKKELELKKKMKPVKYAEAVSNTAMGVARALGSASPPWNFILAAMVGAAGALQIATIAASPYQKGGVVGGKGFGDRVPAMLEPGETVVPRSLSKAGGLQTGQNINITMTGNILSSDWIEDEAVPLLEEALRKGGTLGTS